MPPKFFEKISTRFQQLIEQYQNLIFENKIIRKVYEIKFKQI